MSGTRGRLHHPWLRRSADGVREDRALHEGPRHRPVDLRDRLGTLGPVRSAGNAAMRDTDTRIRRQLYHWARVDDGARDITGQTHHALTCVKFSHVEGVRSVWDVTCECGKRLKLSKPHFHKFKSCGCKRYDRGISDLHRTLRPRWVQMLLRCRSPKHISFKRYGARGIDVCHRWETFENFLADMGPTFEPGLSLDRIDNDKGYSKSNCRWATDADQNRNLRSNVIIDTPWGSMCMKDAAAKAGINWLTLRGRIHAGWNPSLWFTPPTLGGDRRSPQAQAEQQNRRSDC